MSESYELGVMLGPCCACETVGPQVRNVVTLAKRAVIAGHGWGCVVCNLPPDGASYVLCDICFKKKRTPRYACRGYPREDGRIAIGSLTAPFDHDWSKHGPEARRSRIPGYLPGGRPFYWKNETSGQLAAAIEAYFAAITEKERKIDERQLELVREYLTHWINAPCWKGGSELDNLRSRVETLSSSAAISKWTHEAFEIGVDPF